MFYHNTFAIPTVYRNDKNKIIISKSCFRIIKSLQQQSEVERENDVTSQLDQCKRIHKLGTQQSTPIPITKSKTMPS